MLQANHFNIKILQNVDYFEMVEQFAKSKIVLNFTKNLNGGQNLKQMKARIFEGVAAKSLMITEDVQGLSDYFEPDREILTFETFFELKSKLKVVLENDQMRSKIVENGYKRFCKDHTSEIRLNQVFDFIGLTEK